MEDNLEEKEQSLKWALDRVEDNIQDLLEYVQSQLEIIDKERKEATEEGFGILLKNGFNVGVRFLYGIEKREWRIEGISPEGFVAYAIIDGERKRGVLPAYSKEIIEKYLPSLTIIQDEKNIEVSGTTFTNWDNETRREHGLPLKEESEASK